MEADRRNWRSPASIFRFSYLFLLLNFLP